MRHISTVAATHSSIAAQIFALIATILIFVWAVRFGHGLNLYSDDLVFNVHPIVMIIAFILTGEGIMVHKIQAERRIKKLMHMMIQFVALVLGTFGIYVAFKYHHSAYTLHSWLGIVTICLFWLQWLFGFVLFWYPGRAEGTVMVPVHAASGVVIFLLMICTAASGLVQTGDGPGAETRLINVTGLFILLFAVAVCVSAELHRVIPDCLLSLVLSSLFKETIKVYCLRVTEVIESYINYSYQQRKIMLERKQ